MIKQNWIISEGEKNRILSLHKTATKNHYLLFEQDDASKSEYFQIPNAPQPLEINLVKTFPSGSIRLRNTSEINLAISKINSYISKYPTNKFTVVIESSESTVPYTPKGEKQPVTGVLSAGRANSLKNYLVGKLPEGTKIRIDDRGVTGPAWDPKKGRDDNEYTQAQYVKLIVKATVDLCGLTIPANAGSIGNPENGFVSFNKKFDLTDFNAESLKFSFDCYSIPDFVTMQYGNNTLNFGWIGSSGPLSRLLIGTFLYNYYQKSGKPTPKEINRNITPVDLETANGIVNQTVSQSGENAGVSPFKNCFPNLDFGPDELGQDLFLKNKDFKPYQVTGSDIRASFKDFSLRLDPTAKDLEITILSPFTGTRWLFNFNC